MDAQSSGEHILKHQSFAQNYENISLSIPGKIRILGHDYENVTLHNTTSFHGFVLSAASCMDTRRECSDATLGTGGGYEGSQ
jgi:hypothetical protein